MKLPEVTIAIPAFNEENNIIEFLKMILKQKRTTFKLRKIVVYSDGSTDKTNKLVNKMRKQYPLIKLMAYKYNRGKVFRLNKIFRDNQSDILIIFDADGALAGENFIDNLIKPLLSDKKACMVSGHQVLIKPENFEGKIIYSTFLLWDYIRWSIPGKNSVHNYYESATAYRRSFVYKLHIPAGLNESRMYVYMKAKLQNGFRYANDVTLLYRVASTFRDYFKMAKRPFGAKEPILDKIFGPEIENEYIVPRKYVAAGIIKSFIHQPLYTPVAVFLSFFFSRLAKIFSKNAGAGWEAITSTKQAIQRRELLVYES